MVLADVTLMNPESSDFRKTPNPNVMYELGYAAHSKGHEAIVLLANTGSNSSTDWPFDIRNRRMIMHSFNQSNKAGLIRDLTSILWGFTVEPSNHSHPYMFINGAAISRSSNSFQVNVHNDETESYHLDSVEISGVVGTANRNLPPSTTTPHILITGLPYPPYDDNFESLYLVVSRAGNKFRLSQRLNMTHRADGKFDISGYVEEPYQIDRIRSLELSINFSGEVQNDSNRSFGRFYVNGEVQLVGISSTLLGRWRDYLTQQELFDLLGTLKIRLMHLLNDVEQLPVIISDDVTGPDNSILTPYKAAEHFSRLIHDAERL
jgi:hypothetical protein